MPASTGLLPRLTLAAGRSRPARHVWTGQDDRQARTRTNLVRAGFALLVLALLPPATARAESPDRHIEAPRAVIELFTSQGCSACPPADKLMTDMAKRPDVIALTLAVDYWDYLGWKDTLAKHGHSLRQKAYARMRGDGKMFTPQAVVNGHAMTIGSDRPALESTLATIERPPVPVSLKAHEGRLDIGIGPAPAGLAGKGSAPLEGEVWLCPVTRDVKVEIARGENEGTEVTYHNVVRGWIRLGGWKGEAASFDIPVERLRNDGADAVVVVVQSGASATPGPILGASLYTLP